mmetsp:Transcript_37498/g.85242  ORF Transcript_37498/g.85242 Transcript_37498/m.85242 type:complete len:213 (-) Transcript_37498:193-831(-)
MALGPDNTEWLRHHRAVKASDPVAVYNDTCGTEKPLFLDLLGLEDKNYGIGLSEGARTQFSCLCWGFESKPCGSPSVEIPFDERLYMSVIYGNTVEVYLCAGMASGSGFVATTTLEDRNDASAVFLENAEPREFDGRCCFYDKIYIKHVEGEQATYLSVVGDAPDWGLRWVSAEERDPARSVWVVKHGNDFIDSGIRAVGYDPANYPPKKNF